MKTMANSQDFQSYKKNFTLQLARLFVLAKHELKIQLG